MSKKETTAKPTVFIKCPKCGEPEDIVLAADAIEYHQLDTKNIKGNRVTAHSGDFDWPGRDRLECNKCNQKWPVPKNVEFEYM